MPTAIEARSGAVNGYRVTKLVTTMPTSTVYAIPIIVAEMTILSIFASLTREGHSDIVAHLNVQV